MCSTHLNLFPEVTTRAELRRFGTPAGHRHFEEVAGVAGNSSSDRGSSSIASQARLFRTVAELTARESHEEEQLLPELLQREKSLVAFENVIVTWIPDPVS